MGKFKAYRIREVEKKAIARFEDLSLEDLDPGEVVVRVAYSSVNYKDALAATGAGKIIRRFPCVGGIDLSGTVTESADARFSRGDAAFRAGTRSSARATTWAWRATAAMPSTPGSRPTGWFPCPRE